MIDDERNSERRSVIGVKLVNPSSSPEALIIIIKHIIWHKGGPTERASFLIVVDPTVHAGTVENVLAVAHAPNLLLLGELEQANRAGAAVLSGGNVGVSELGDGQEVPDQERRHGGGPCLRRV